MKLVVEGIELPGRTFCSDGEILVNVHVGVQVGSMPEELVAGDSSSARWEVDVRTLVADDGGWDFRGPAVQGRRGDRFVYLTWGNVAEDGTFTMFRRAKLMLDRIDREIIDAAAGSGVLVATVRLTDDRGGPRCARVDPPAVTWAPG